MNNKIYNALTRAENYCWARAASFIIIPPNSAVVNGQIKYGKIKVAYPKDGAGKLQVFVSDCEGNDLQYGAASGFGYDKLSAALMGLKFDEIVFTDHPENWETQLRNAGYTVIKAI